MKKLSSPAYIPSQPVFTGCEDENLWNVPGYHRNLPHWRLEGATYFVTFRLADSIPAAVAERWQSERRAWLLSQGIKPHWEREQVERFESALAAVPTTERERFEREQTRQFFIELDLCHGCCVLRDAHGIVATALEHFHGSRAWLGDYVVMPNHVHVIVQPFPGIALEEWSYSIKRFSSTQINKRHVAPKRTGHLWQTESFDRVIRDAEELFRTRDYIGRNGRRLSPGDFTLKQFDWLNEFAPLP